MTEPVTDAPDAPVKDPGKGLGRKLIAATVVGVLVFAGMSAYGDVRALADNLGRYHWIYFVGGIALATLNYALRFLRWEYYLHLLGVKGVPKLESARIFFSGFVMAVTPGKVGEVFKSWLLHEARGVSIARTAPIVVAERLTDLVALVLLAAVGSLALDEGWAVAAFSGAIVVVIWLACAWRPLGLAILRLCDRLPVIKKIAPKLREAYDALQVLVRPAPLGVATVLSLGAWGLEVVSLWVIVRGFPGVELGWLESTFGYAVPTIVGALAMMPGGLGVTEAGMTGVLETMGLEAPVATASTMLVRLATLWWAVVLGLFALSLHRRAMMRR